MKAKIPSATLAPWPYPLAAGDPCLDFIDTTLHDLDGRVIERLGTFDDVLAWSVAAGMLTADEAHDARQRWGATTSAAKAVREALDFRTKLRDAVDALIRGVPVPPRSLDAINACLARPVMCEQLYAARERGRSSVTLTTVVRFHTPADVLVPIARAARDLFVAGETSMIKRCANPQCLHFFYDHTKSHRRRWCNMAVCGNRAKVAAFRERRQVHGD